MPVPRGPTCSLSPVARAQHGVQPHTFEDMWQHGKRKPVSEPSASPEPTVVVTTWWDTFMEHFLACYTSHTVRVVRALLALPALVLSWCGMWIILDEHVPGGYGFSKQLILVAISTALMLFNRTFFRNAGMGSVDIKGNLGKLASKYAEGNIDTAGKIEFYCRSIMATVVIVTFWDGVYNICDMHIVREETITYDVGCMLVGSFIVVVITHIEDSRSFDIASYYQELLAGRRISFNEAPWYWRFVQYLIAFAGNIAPVVFWRGADVLLDRVTTADRFYSGAVCILGGMVVVVGMNRLLVDSGVDEDANMGGAPGLRMNRGAKEEIAPVQSLWTTIVNSESFNIFQSLVELFGVLLVWHGIEFYFWDDMLLPETPGRDFMYVVVSTLILLATNTFIPLSGMVSPMWLFQRVHVANNEEELPILHDYEMAEDDLDSLRDPAEPRSPDPNADEENSGYLRYVSEEDEEGDFCLQGTDDADMGAGTSLGTGTWGPDGYASPAHGGNGHPLWALQENTKLRQLFSDHHNRSYDSIQSAVDRHDRNSPANR